MIDIRTQNAAPLGPDINSCCPTTKHGICWASIFAGAVGTMAVSFALFVLASSYGLAIASPWSGEGVSATAVGVNAIIAIIVIQWLSSAFGGFLAGRLRTSWSIHTDEVCFRDTAHGFLTWAVATLVMVVMLNSAAMDIAKGSAAGAVFAAASSKGSSANTNDPNAYFIDTLFRTNKPSADTSSADTHMEATRILAKSFSEENISPDDKAYLSTVVANRTGLSVNEASARIDTTVVDMKKAADKARKAAATLAIFTFLSLLIGAFIASVAATLGGRCRDECATRI